jgi:hypothetical protein
LIDPVRYQVVADRPIGSGSIEEDAPRIRSTTEALRERLQSPPLRDVLPYRVSLVAVYPSLPLFQIDGIGRQIPVIDGMAVGMEVEPLLPDGRRGEDERPKW